MTTKDKKEMTWPMKILSFFFVAIFTAAAAYLAYTFVSDLQATERARNWVATPATVVNYEIVTKERSLNERGDPNEKIKAEYTYSFNGTPYTGTSVDFTGNTADNFSQERRARQMDTLAKKDITVYVNPDNPAEAVVDRSLPAERVLFYTFFLFFPCGFATACVVFMALYPVKPLYKYAPQIWSILHGAPALWLLLRYSGEYGWRGIALLILIASLIPAAIYTGVRKIGKEQ